jgi:amidohydrolase
MHNLDALIASILPEIIRIRHDLHAHPQLGYEETYASGVVQQCLQRWGIPYVAGLAETGVVAWIEPLHVHNGSAAIGLRADLDGLPIVEASGLPYASIHPGRMHACGHDGHTSILLAAAKVLLQIREKLPRPVKLVFQPAEEVGAGAQRMIEHGALSAKVGGRRVAAMFGLHGTPHLPVGFVATKAGPLLAGCVDFDITIHGTGGHAALPQFTVDPVVTSATLVLALQTIVSRNVDPILPAVVSVGSIHGGDAANVVPDAVKITGTIRAHDEAVFRLVQQRVIELAQHTAQGMNCRSEVEYTPAYPAVINHPEMTEFAIEAARQAVGENQFVRLDTAYMPSEDFAFYGKEVPSCFSFIGVCPLGQPSYPPLHSPKFDFTDAALPIGIRLMCEYALSADRIAA